VKDRKREQGGTGKLARQIVTREKISELLESLLLRWTRMSFFRGLWKSSSKHKSESKVENENERNVLGTFSRNSAMRKFPAMLINEDY
jgi:hypothetical protein